MSAGDLPVATSASSYQQLKSMLTLDLSSETPAKKRRTTMPFGIDYEKLQTQIISPLIASLHTVTTPTPTKIFGQQDVSQAQAQYAQGFLDALSHVQRLNNFIPNNIPSPSLLNPLLTFPTTTPSITSNPITSSSALLPPASLHVLKAKATSTACSNTSSSSSAAAAAAAVAVAAAAAAAVTSTVPSVTLPKVPEPSSSKEPPKVPEVSVAPQVSVSLPPTSSSSLATSTASCAANDIVRYIELINMQNSHHHADSTGGLMSPFLFPSVVPNSAGNSMLPNAKGFPPGMPNPNMLSPQFLNQIQPRDCDMPSSSGASIGMSNMFPSMPCPMPPASIDDGSMDGASCSSSRSQEDLSFIGVDLDDQERKKLERKRARNRLAATKCRQRKLEKIQELEGLVSHERTRGANLLQDIDNLRKSIAGLQNQLKHHRSQGCVLGINDP